MGRRKILMSKNITAKEINVTEEIENQKKIIRSEEYDFLKDILQNEQTNFYTKGRKYGTY